LAKDKKKKDKKSAKSAAGLKALTENPLIGEVVAAALVATASALKDSNRARALASHASDELEKLSKSTGDRGGALWEMALQIGRRSLDAMMAGDEPKAAKAKAAKAKPTAAKDGPKPKAAGKKASKASTR
jgi:hypothetical protein